MTTKTAPKMSSDPLRYKRGISFNIYMPSDELYLKDELEARVAAGESHSVSALVLRILKLESDKQKK